MDNKISTVMLPERVDSETSSMVETLIFSEIRPGRGVIVDGSSVTYMSAAGVRTFARSLHRAEEKGAHIVFCRFGGAAADCLLVSGFTELLEIAASTEEAVARLRPKLAGPPVQRLHARTAAG